MKHIKIVSGIILLTTLLASCSNKQVVNANNVPSIVGVKDITCIVNNTVDFLDGVTALDKEDGDITPNMKISVSPAVDVVDGYATFKEAGEYSVTYTISDKEGRTVSKESFVDVKTREEYVSFKMPEGFYSENSGKATFKKCGMINGEFVIEASGQEIAEDIKISRKFDIKTNIQYTFKYAINAECSGKIKVLADDIECAEVKINEGYNNVSFKHIILDDAVEHKDVEISLCLGNIANDIKLKILKVETEYPQEAGKLVDLTDNFSFVGRVQGRFDGTKGNAFDGDDGKVAVLEVTEISEDIWRGGMFINTSINLKQDTLYHISFDISNDFDKPFEVLLQRDQWNEILIEKFISPDGHVEHSFTADNVTKGALWIYVQSGNQVNNVRLSNLKIYETLGPVGYDSYRIEDFSESHGAEFDSEFSSNLGSYKYVVKKFGPNDYDNKVNSPTFYVNGSGNNYVLSFNAKASAPIEVVIAAPVAGGWDPTLMWYRVVLNKEMTNYTLFFRGSGSDRDYIIAWQFGSGNNQQHENVEIEVSDISISLRDTELDGKNER